MGPKKAAKKGGGGDEDRDYDQENAVLMSRVETLHHKLMMKNEHIAKSRTACEDLRRRLSQLDHHFSEEASQGDKATGEMRRQYTEMETNFLKIMDNLQKQVADSKDDIENVQRTIETTQVEKDEVIAAKDAEIRRLQMQMETMAIEFADMLKETLDKMSQRVEVTHIGWDRDGGAGRPPLMNRLKEFALLSTPPDRSVPVSAVPQRIQINPPAGAAEEAQAIADGEAHEDKEHSAVE
ncbi:unnamed protein product [Vitrella brassicaformis CCMP3155]|uniref:Dynein regulatory complex protein 12 n=1 Tax=Vitrella brassicaformis (strain CCMP3155) TaxID=1169540 RepID=A0A0G4F3E1_VITBC|nr:unnamed protein product [Vitrella brassicaformis CCMP3155]|mmetsp:Transcript_31482/g.77975  ORF Transcript_31482/g.77975 Transcript_31482/m.77975 type:complete len:238 (-) Transcript_31482:100-813(-)|eukprot:CEM06708.1 unnamed protein product [Vitrella brassicaformis CCMP3155]